MSFSTEVKEEIARHLGHGRHCQLAEIAAIINMCGRIRVVSNEEAIIKIQTENAAVARKYFTLIKKTFNINTEVLIRRNTYLKKNRVYIIIVTDTKKGMNILQATKLLNNKNGMLKHAYQISPLIVQSTCCKRAYIRGAFLGGGSLSDPEKTYHLEFVNPNKVHSLELQSIINSFGMDAKIIQRKRYYIVYLKEGTQIVDLLNIMEAHIALMELENVRILKEMRNNVNRIVNCETANLNKTVSAAVKQCYDINYIDDIIGLDKLPEPLEEMARVRLQYKSASLKELGTYLNPPVGKSGVNHRLRKISEIAEKLKEERDGLND
ncbi:MAG: DNA-binding protein WhiA [Eubacteriales bacterium]